MLPLLLSHLCHYVTSVTVTSLPLLHAITLLPCLLLFYLCYFIVTSVPLLTLLHHQYACFAYFFCDFCRERSFWRLSFDETCFELKSKGFDCLFAEFVRRGHYRCAWERFRSPNVTTSFGEEGDVCTTL